MHGKSCWWSYHPKSYNGCGVLNGSQYSEKAHRYDENRMKPTYVWMVLIFFPQCLCLPSPCCSSKNSTYLRAVLSIHHSFIFHTFLSIFNLQIEWIEKYQNTKINKGCMRDKKMCVDRTTLYLTHQFFN